MVSNGPTTPLGVSLYSASAAWALHGKEQARGVVAQFLGRRLGRALLRGAVRFRHVALAAVGGVEIQEPAASRGAAGHLGDEWCAPGRPWVPHH